MGRQMYKAAAVIESDLYEFARELAQKHKGIRVVRRYCYGGHMQRSIDLEYAPSATGFFHVHSIFGIAGELDITYNFRWGESVVTRDVENIKSAMTKEVEEYSEGDL